MFLKFRQSFCDHISRAAERLRSGAISTRPCTPGSFKMSLPVNLSRDIKEAARPRRLRKAVDEPADDVGGILDF